MSEEIERTNPKPLPVDRFSLLWRRVNDHRIVQWGVAYVALAYGIQHGVTLTSEPFDWPHAVARISMLLLALGLPLVMTLAWYHGDRATKRISGGEAAIVTVLLVLVSLVFYVFVRPAEPTVVAAREAGVSAARRAATDPHGAISVAVMPFANVSGDAAQEFFSDGMTDEISGALAKIPDLRVVARSSAFQFKGKNQDARSMGQALGATHLIEGSVRRAGDRVRVSAELVKAEDGLRIWSENYDRELTDVFAIQEDIARAITASLRMPLGLKPGENLVNNRTRDPASYEDYLRAKALLRSRIPRNMAEAVKLLEAVVARDPDFAPAWGLLGGAYADSGPRFSPVRLTGDVEHARPIIDANEAKREAVSQHALRLDPNNADGYASLAGYQKYQGNYVEGMDLFARALALDPNNPEILNGYSIGFAELGLFGPALEMRVRLQALEPFVPLFSGNFATMLWASGRTDAAVDLYRSLAGRMEPTEVMASQGRLREAADAMAAQPLLDPLFAKPRDAAVAILRAAASKNETPQRLPNLGNRGWVYAYTATPERFLEYHEGNIKNRFGGGLELVHLWAPAYASVRKTERFKKFVLDAGMVKYWRAKGWPPQCHPTTADDFACN